MVFVHKFHCTSFFFSSVNEYLVQYIFLNIFDTRVSPKITQVVNENIDESNWDGYHELYHVNYIKCESDN